MWSSGYGYGNVWNDPFYGGYGGYGGCSGSVSYTHLRAHETVLDLVCRLLLEKKNNINVLLRDNYTNETT